MNEQELKKLRGLEQKIEQRLYRMHDFEAGEEEIVSLSARLASVTLFERMRGGEALEDERFLTAGEAEAYYQYRLYRDTQAELSGFTAGDIAYEIAGDALEKARIRRDRAFAQARTLLEDPDGFWFRRI